MLRAKNNIVSARVDSVVLKKIQDWGMNPQTAIVSALNVFLGIKDEDYTDFTIDQD